ncbi:MAG: tRNA1(Val) (adenine(37)-N6)-methyltransferase [Lachnospiraceae bacterium]|nr:tRNA1(Val) (adenine(37)-N6)-methyltransferase [Lachnospiraceae bacterium]
MAISLQENERLDDLQRNGLKIIQKRDGFCFGMDAVLLSGFAKIKSGERTLDMGTGTGIIPLLLSAKTKGAYFAGLEIQAEMAKMAARSVALNGLEEKIEIIQGDIKEAGKLFKAASFDVVTANPPYMNDAHGLKNPMEEKAVARHEILCTLEDVIREGAGLLKTGGRMYMVHRPHRLAELIGLLSKYRMEPKRLKFVHPYLDKAANMVLIEAVRGGGAWLKLEAPVIVYKEPGMFTDEIYEIYGY